MVNNILKKEALVYGVGHILTRMITFLLLPLFTNTLTTHEYGVLSLVYAFCGFFTVILHLGLDASLLKHYKSSNKQEKILFTTNTYIPLLILNIIFVFLFIFLKDILASPILGTDNSFIFILMLLIVALDGLWAIPMVLLRADNAPFQYLTYTLSNVVANIIFIYLFFFIFQWGVLGIIISNTLSSFLIFLISLPIIIKKISFSTLQIRVLKKLLKFGSPFIVAGIFSMIIELSDRYIIKYLLGLEMVGIYNAGYKLGMLMLLVIMGFNMAWQPYFLDSQNNNKKILESAGNHAWIIFFIICGTIICLIDPISKISFFGYTLIGENFSESLTIVPIICLSYLFHGAYIIQLPGPFLTNKTSYIATIRGVAAISNIVLNFILIPHYSIMGAAIATLISFILASTLILYINKKIFPLNYNLYWFLSTIVILILYIIIIQMNPNIIIRFIMLIFMPIFLFFIGYFNTNDKYKN